MEQADMDSHLATGMTLGQRIIGWTNNLLATSVVIIIALVVGTHLVSSWSPEGSSGSPSPTPSSVDNWPTLASCSLEFGDAPFQIERSSFPGSEKEVLQELLSRCQESLILNPLPATRIGDAEKRMVAGLPKLNPVAEDPGHWRIFHVRNTVGESNAPEQLPQVVGVRDDCPDSDINQDASRLVVWGLAVPTENESWTTFVGKASTGDSKFGIAGELVPKDSRRTLVLTEPGMASVTGFVGSDLATVKSHFDDLSKVNSWESQSIWLQNGNNWTRRFTASPKSALQGIQVQLHANHTDDNQNLTNPTVRGMITLTGKKIEKDSK